MCKFWKQEKTNHHFPELRRERRWWSWLKRQLTFSRLTKGTIGLTVVVASIYFIQTNLTATQGYQIQALEEQRQILVENNKKLEGEYVQLQSMARLIAAADHLQMVPIDQAEVITPTDSVVALR